MHKPPHLGLTTPDDVLPALGLSVNQPNDEFSFPESPWVQYLENVEQLDPAKRLKLLRLCKVEGLSSEAMQGVEESARLLREFEKYGKTHLQTPVQRSAGIENVSKLAEQLSLAIDKLTLIDQVTLQNYWPNPQHNVTGNITFSGLNDNVAAIGLEAKNLSVAASKMHGEISQIGKRGGRKPTLQGYAAELDWVWCSVWPDGVELGRGGKFERICEAVFVAAEVHAHAAGAVRYFVEKYMPAKERAAEVTASGIDLSDLSAL